MEEKNCLPNILLNILRQIVPTIRVKLKENFLLSRVHVESIEHLYKKKLTIIGPSCSNICEAVNKVIDSCFMVKGSGMLGLRNG